MICVVAYLVIGFLVVLTKAHRLMQWHLESMADFFPIDGFAYMLIEDWDQETILGCRSWKEYFQYRDPRTHNFHENWPFIFLWLVLVLCIVVSYPMLGLYKVGKLLP
ncbi:MAG: hypothetical protein WCT27_04870 [Patescibacteria group bacterium]